MKRIKQFIARFIKFFHGMFSAFRPSPRKSGGGGFENNEKQRPVTYDRFGRPVKWLDVQQKQPIRRYGITWSRMLKDKFRLFNIGYYCKYREFVDREGDYELRRIIERF